MKTRYLFPNSYKKFGWVMLVLAIAAHVTLRILGIDEIPVLKMKVFALIGESHGLLGQSGYFVFINHNETGDILAIFAIIGGILTAFSKEKNEDEYIAKIRLESLLWATYINYVFLLLSIILVYGMPFLWVMLYNMFTLLIIFITRFNYLLYKNRKAASYEK